MSPPSWVAGFHAVESRLKAGRLARIEMDRGRQDRRARQLAELAGRYGVPLRRVGGAELDQRVAGIRHQGVIGELTAGDDGAAPLRWQDCIIDVSCPLLLVLDGVEDPRNLGACLRVADGAGAQAVVVPKRRAAGLNMAARKTAAGAADEMPLVVEPNLTRCLKAMRAAGLWVVGLADGSAGSLYAEDLNRPLALVLGSEGQGLRRLVSEQCDALVSLPMAGSVSSLNVSVAAGVALYEAVRQRHR